MKICSHCKKTKAISDFHSNKRNKDHLNDACKVCHIVRNKIYYKKNKQEILKKLKQIVKSPQQKKKLKEYMKTWTKKQRDMDLVAFNKIKAKYAREWRKRNPEKVKESHLKRNYNLTLKDVKLIIKKQNNICPICKKKLDKGYVIDHCHKTTKVRGVLCRRCNTSLGLFKDSSVILKRAIGYLNRSSK